MIEPVLHPYQNGFEVRLKPHSAVAGRVWVYVFGLGTPRTEKDLTALRNRLTSHVGSVAHPAVLAHLGANRAPLALGAPHHFGTVSSQGDALNDFLKTLSECAGEYGSWWTATWEVLEPLFNLTYPARRVTLLLFQENHYTPPLEFNSDTVLKWMQARNRNWGTPASFRIISAADRTRYPPGTQAFLRGESALVSTLEDFLSEAPPAGTLPESLLIEILPAETYSLPIKQWELHPSCQTTDQEDSVLRIQIPNSVYAASTEEIWIARHPSLQPEPTCRRVLET